MATLPPQAFPLPKQTGYHDAAEVSQQQTHAAPVSGTGSTTCSPLAKPDPPSTSRTRRPNKSRHLKCDLEGCAHRGTFSREWELQRHIQSKHPRADAGSFVCRAEGCFNKQLPWTFTRPDKLTSHIKAVHTRDTVFTACPVSRCNFGRCTLETLGVHLVRGHHHGGSEVLNASTCKLRKCPLWRCGKHLKARDLPGHVTGHAKDDVLAAIAELEHEGLVVLSALESSQSVHTMNITVRCPVCNTTSDDVDGFVAHFWDCHLFLAGSGGADHFESWKSRLVEVTTKWDQHGRINGLPPWAHLGRSLDFKARIDRFQCSSCLLSFDGFWRFRFGRTESQQAALKAISAHHLSLLRPEAEVIAELYPHRMQILRLYPEFVSHPVFADFDGPQDGSAPSSQEPSHFDGTGFIEGVENHGQPMADSNKLF
jgi:hypothetical protein